MKVNGLKLVAFIVSASAIVACSDDKTKKTEGDGEESRFDTKVIYGEDNRRDLYQVSDTLMLQLADSTVALIRPSNLKANGGQTQIVGVNYGTTYNLCSDEPFREQDSAAFCSGSLVAPDIVITAGHCIRSQDDCNNTRFVFGFAVKQVGRMPSSVATTEVYSCASLIKSQVDSGGADFAVARLNRSVTNHAALKVHRGSDLGVGQRLAVIGHPAGIPVKVADGAQVRSVQNDFYVANLDTYGGNSGSAVFNQLTGEIEGILVRGDMDFRTRGDCRVSNICSNEGCRGEDVTKISRVVPFLPGQSNPPPPPPPADVTFSSGSLSLKVPDNSISGVENKITVNQIPSGRKVLIQVNITHPYRGDLVVSLVTPEGREVVLQNRAGRSANDIKGTFGLDLVAAQDLAILSQVNRTGQWTLKVSDRSKFDEGTLSGWAVIFKK